VAKLVDSCLAFGYFKILSKNYFCQIRISRKRKPRSAGAADVTTVGIDEASTTAMMMMVPLPLPATAGSAGNDSNNNTPSSNPAYGINRKKSAGGPSKKAKISSNSEQQQQIQMVIFHSNKYQTHLMQAK
jgi:hypothetical protein